MRSFFLDFLVRKWYNVNITKQDGKAYIYGDAKWKVLLILLQKTKLLSKYAVKNKRIVPIMLGDMYASGVRTINGIETISQGLYPDLNK